MMYTPPYTTGGAGATPDVQAELEKKKKAANSGADDGAATAMDAAPATANPVGTMPGMPPTFSEMQRNGYARPAPPGGAGAVAAPAMPGAVPGQPAAAAAPALPGAAPTFGMPTTPTVPNLGAGGPSAAAQALQQLLLQPSSYADAGFSAEMQKGARAIDDQFALKENRIREEMIQRGLGDSSVLGGELADLNVGKRSAMQGLAETLGIKRAETEGADRRAAIALALQKEGMDADQAWRQAEMKVRADEFAATMGLNRDELAARREESAADRALRKEDMAFNQMDSTRRFGLAETAQAQEMERFAKMFGLDLEKLGYMKERDTKEDAFRDKSFEYTKGRDAASDAFRDKSFDYQAGRDKVGDEQWQKGYDLNKDQMGTENIMKFWEMLMRDFLGQGA